MIIVFLSDIPWFGLHQRPQHMALALSKHWQILWVEPVTLQSKIHLFPVQVESNIHILTIPFFPYNARNKWLRGTAKFLGSFKLTRILMISVQNYYLRRALKHIGDTGSPIGFFVQNFQAVALTKRYRTSFILYDYIDNAFGFTKLPKHAEKDWERIIKSADIITVTSPTLQRQIEFLRSDDVYLVGNGVEYNRFSESKSQGDYGDLPADKPVVGYIGAVYPWLDFELIEYLTQNMKIVNFIFIGAIHPEVNRFVRKLENQSNVRFLGFKEYSTIPGYLSRFAVGIIPFRKNKLTASVNPVKLYEYCAAGKPTVATDFSEDLLQFKDKIFIARTNEDFIELLGKAIQKSKDSAFISSLKSFASENDWNNKTSKIIQLIQQYTSTLKST